MGPGAPFVAGPARSALATSAARPALALAERIRGAIYVIVSMSIIYTTFITLTEGVTGLTEIVMFLINSFFGRILVFFIGFAYLIYGIWKIVMGCD